MQRYRAFFTLVNERPGGANEYINQQAGTDAPGAWPRVSTVRVRLTSSTVKSSSPEEVVASYEAWRLWAEGVRSVRHARPLRCRASRSPRACLFRIFKSRCLQTSPKPSLFVSSPEWITAVTYTEISNSVYTTVFLSIALAGVVVFIFAGKPILTVFATLTVLFINLTVMGILYLRCAAPPLATFRPSRLSFCGAPAGSACTMCGPRRMYSRDAGAGIWAP